MIHFTPFEKVKDADVIITYNEINNKLPLCNFMDNILLKIPSDLKVLTYTIEGDPIFNHILYDGENIKYIYNDLVLYKEYLGNKIVRSVIHDVIYYNLYNNNILIKTMFGYRN